MSPSPALRVSRSAAAAAPYGRIRAPGPRDGCPAAARRVDRRARSAVLAAGMAFFFINTIWSLIAGKKAPANPWGEGATTLEWTLSSPPPFHQFNELPVVKPDAH